MIRRPSCKYKNTNRQNHTISKMADSDDETIVKMNGDDGEREMMDTSMNENYENMLTHSRAINKEIPSKASTSNNIFSMPELEEETIEDIEDETIVEIDDEEEGEIMDEDDSSMDEDDTNIFGHSTAMDKVSSAPALSAANPIFTTGVNIFDKVVQEKLQERAKRFALKPEEINSLNEQDLQHLHDSLGINQRNKQEVKFEIVHLHGLDDMTGKDVVDYFANYAPEGIEWLDRKSCNIVWLDNLSAARALHFLSRMVKGMPARAPTDFLDIVEADDEPDGQSILIKLKNREIELQNEIAKLIRPKKKTYPANAVDIAEISIPIPPGFWRLGVPHPKTKGLLMRFGNLTDKIPFKSEKCNKYYKTLSNPTSPRRFISEFKKNDHEKGIFGNNKELTQTKNPWGSLAMNWDRDSKFRERDPIMYNDKVQVPVLKNYSLQARLGTKRISIDGQTENQEEIEAKTNNEKKSKVPRMRMYADEEEDKEKKRKILTAIRKQEVELTKSGDDLRNMLGHSKIFLFKKDKIEPDPNADLGLRLKNRIQKMSFAVDKEPKDDYDPYDDYDDGSYSYPNIRVKISGRRSPEESLTESETGRSPMKFRSPLLRSRTERDIGRRHRTPIRSRNRTPERTLYSDRLHSDRLHTDRLHLRKHTPYRRAHSPRSTDSRYRSHGHRDSERTSRNVNTEVRKPKVASTVWSKIVKPCESNESDQSDEESQKSSTSSDTSESSSESSDSDSSTQSSRRITARNPDRPEFGKRRFNRERKWKT